MVDSKRFRDWLDKAGKDLEAARILKQHDSFNDTVAFHCQQAIEKALMKPHLPWIISPRGRYRKPCDIIQTDWCHFDTNRYSLLDEGRLKV